MWNETDLDQVRHHLDRAVAEGMVFADPNDLHVGRDALEANVRRFRTERPRLGFRVSSGVDLHHDRCRYEWQLVLRHRVLMTGLYVASFDRDGLIESVDGFFGPLPPSS